MLNIYSRYLNKWIFPFIVIICVIFISPIFSFGDEIKVVAQLSNNVIYIGNNATLEVKVKGSDTDDIKVKAPEVDGLSIKYQGSQSYSSYQVIINGKQVSGSQDRSYTYSIIPSKMGNYDIPPIEMEIDGQIYTTNKVSFSVSEAPKDKNIQFTVKLSKDTCYITESVEIDYKLYYSNQIRTQNNENPLSIPVVNQNEIKNEFNTEVISEKDDTESMNGTIYNVKKIKLRITPTKAGNIIIPAANFKCYVPSGGYDVKQDFWGRTVKEAKLKPAYASTGSVNLHVKSVPEENKPAGYSGAVGEYKIEIDTKDTLVKMMDPILLQINIIGSGKLDDLRCPILPEIKELTENFKIIFNPTATGQVKKDRITFEQSIHPKSVNITEIPAIPFSYFNTKEEKYVTVYSRPIHIKVLPNEKIDSSDVIGADQDGNNKVEIEEGEIGLKANYHLLDALTSERIHLSYMLFLLLLPLGYLLTYGIVNRQKRLKGNIALMRAKEAKTKADEKLSEAKSNISTADFFDYLSKGLGSYLSDKFNLGSGEFTTMELANLKNDTLIDEKVFTDIKDILDFCDEARFGGIKINIEKKIELLNNAKSIIKILEKQK